MVDALILAGSPNNGPLKDCSKARYEALITIGQKSMIEYVVDALAGCSLVDRIVVVGPQKELTGVLGERKVIIGNVSGNVTDNVVMGLKQIPDANRVLLATSDIPLLTPQAIEDFLSQCQDQEADLYYPIVPREVVESKFANSPRTYVNLREGVFTGGNVFLLNPAIVEECIPKGQEIIKARKSPLQLCRLVGLMFLLKFLTRSITLSEAQEKVSRLLGIRGRVVISGYPEVGVDVDKPSDLDMIIRLMGPA